MSAPGLPAAPAVRVTPAPAPGAREAARRRPWLIVAALTCPCHLPIYLLILSGTGAGVALAEHWLLAALALAAVFALAVRGVVRSSGGSRPVRADVA